MERAILVLESDIDERHYKEEDIHIVLEAG